MFNLIEFSLIKYIMVQFGSVRFSSVRFSSVRFSSVQFEPSYLKLNCGSFSSVQDMSELNHELSDSVRTIGSLNHDHPYGQPELILKRNDPYINPHNRMQL